jgi:predicted dehydrogenase
MMSFNAGQLGRRAFLKQSAAASAAFAAAMEAFRARRAQAEEAAREAAAAPGRPVNIAIIGSGSEGNMLLGEAVKSPGVFCKAVCDIWPTSKESGLKTIRSEKTYAGYRKDTDLEEALKIAKDAKGYDDYKEMLEKEKDIEAVIIATPLHTHAEILLAALAAGKHVYCEKMMAMTVEDCKKVGRAARDSKKIVQFGHQQHWNDWYLLGHKLIHNDKVCGDRITHMGAWWFRNGTWRRPVSDTEKSMIDAAKYGYKDVDELRNWRMYWKTSGGLMSELACHQIDMANWYANAVPTLVIARGGSGTRDDWQGEVYDNVQCIFEYPKGVTLTYQAISTNSHAGQGEEFMGPDGTVQLSRTGGNIFREPKAAKLAWEEHATKTKDDKGKGGIVLKTGSTVTDGSAQKGEGLKGVEGGKKDPFKDYRAALAEWANLVREGKPEKVKTGWETSLKAAVPCIKANEAMQKKAWVEIKPEDYQI